MSSLILSAVSLGSAAFGAIASVVRIADMNQAKEMAQRTQKHYEYAIGDLKADWEGTNKLAQQYGQFQIDVMMRTIGRFVNFIERNSDQVKQSENEFLEGLEGISVEQLQEYKAAIIEAKQFFIGIAQAIGTTAGYSGAMSLATSLGVASTEMAISELSGAAAWNAIMASLGTNTAVGSGDITVNSAIFIDGFEGENAWAKVQEYKAKINIRIAKIDAVKDCMQQVRRRITELRSLLESLNNRAVLGLNELELFPAFDKYRDGNKFQQVGLLVKALAEVMKTSVLESEGFARQKVNSAESWQYIVSVYTDYLKLAQQEKTKQREIEAWEKETIAKIKRERKLLITYLELWFGDHAGSYSASLAVVDSAIAFTGQSPIAQSAAPTGIASGNHEQLGSALNSIIEIAKARPFQELANLASVSATLVKPNQEWTF
jgi:hypothetical protein